MMADWTTEIARIVSSKQTAAEHDIDRALPWHLPRVGAGPENIVSAENATGSSFSQQFKEFLSLADGWQGFYILTDLFGTKEFVSGKPKSILQRPEVVAYMAANNLSVSNVAAIGGSDFNVDVFLHLSPDAKMLPGGVVWLANEEIDRYSSFEEFLAAMVNYNARIAQKMISTKKVN